MKHSILALAALAGLSAAASADPVLNAATLPNSRAVPVNTPATVFASVINSGDVAATNCRVALGAGADPSLSVGYEPADGAGNINGPANTPVTINAGNVQQFVIAVTASAPYSGAVPLAYVCDNGQAISSTGLNDVNLHATAGAGPDIITIAATLTGDGIMNTNANGRGIISISAVNIGAGDPPPDGVDAPLANEASIGVSMSYTNFEDGAQHPLTICRTNASAVCQTPFSQTIGVAIGDAPVTFNVALQQIDGVGVPFFPGEYRLRIEFRDQNQNLVGATSVAPRSGSPTVQAQVPHGFWDLFIRDNSDPAGSFTRVGRLFFPPDGGTPVGAVVRNPGQEYAQPVVLQGDLNFDNGSRFIGCMRFLDTGSGDAANPGLNLRFVPRHFMRGSYDSASADACPPQGDIRIDRPQIDPVNSSGQIFGAYAPLQNDDDGGTGDPPVINWTVTNPVNENDPYGNVTYTSNGSGGFTVSGTYRGCTITGTAVRYGTVSSVMGARLAFQVSYTSTNCPQGVPGWATGNLMGVLLIGTMPDGSNNVDALHVLFDAGYNNGDVSSWSATVAGPN